MKDFNIKKISSIACLPLELLLEADPSEAFIKDYFSRGEGYEAYLGSRLAGAYILLKTKPLTMEIMNISVNEEDQGKGIGKALVLDAAQRAKNAGARILEVGTGNSSTGQLAFYQKCGFRIVGVDLNFFKKRYPQEIVENGIKCIDMIRMEMNL